MLDTRVDTGTLCFVEAIKQKGPYASCGVFIAPRRILTTFHSVSGAKKLTFTAANGNSTIMKRLKDGGVHVMDKALDLAVVEVELDTHSDFAAVNMTGKSDKSLFQRNKGWLGTMYNRSTKVHDVTFDPIEDILSSSTSNFKAAVRAVPGYSGSPVFGSDGFTVVSIATHIDRNQQERDIAWSQVMETGTLPQISFKGPSVKAFSQFMQKVNGRTNFDPSGPKI